MQILAITQHPLFVDRLRTAFAGSGHDVSPLPDAVHALAHEGWGRTRILIVEAGGDPLDGYRLCHLLRGPSRMLFKDLAIFILLEHTPQDEDQARLVEAEGDGFLDAEATPAQLQRILAPVLAGERRAGPAPAPLLACSLEGERLEGLRAGVAAAGFPLGTCTGDGLLEALAQGQPPVIFLGLAAHADDALHLLDLLARLPNPPYPILVGDLAGEARLQDLLGAGAFGWLDQPQSAARVQHAVRRGLAWQHTRRIQRECTAQIHALVERRGSLEVEAQALRSEVLMDPLTGLLNRRAFNQNLEHAINQWVRHGRPFVLILGDLDYFKLINDRFGHMVGDVVLKTVSQRIRASLRRSDLAFRIGGEEFAILLTETQLSAGLDVADKIRRRIDETPVTLESGQAVFPTMSFGIGKPDGEDAAALFSRVDQALYAAKHKGRNRVEVSEPDR